MTQLQTPTEPVRHSAARRRLRYTPALASACVAAFATVLLLVPATGTPQTGKPPSVTPPSGERQLGGATYSDNVDDPAEWGKAFPRQYESYKKSIDMQRTKHGGSEAMPQTPTKADPRSVVARSKVEEDAGLKAMWQGYAYPTAFDPKLPRDGSRAWSLPRKALR